MIGLTTVIIISIYAYFTIQSQDQVLISEVERHASQLSETVKKSTRHEMMTYRWEYIREIISTISEDPYYGEIRVLNKEGKIIYSTTEKNTGKMVDKNAESCYACHAEDKPLESLSIPERTRIFSTSPDSVRILGIINPIYNEPSCWKAACHAHAPDQKVLGVLDVTISLREVDNQIEKSKIRIALFAIIAILAISIMIGVFIKRWVDKPVNYLLEATKQLASGNLTYTIKSKGDDELAMLAKSFNKMTKKLAEARQQLFQSDKMASLGRLAAGVAHEINNPLTGILTYSSFLQKRIKGMPDVQDDLKVIVRETLRSREIVKNLLDFARQSIPKKKKSNINDIIDRAIKVVENQMGLKHIKIKTDLNPHVAEITLDANQIQQVFINLFVNAADAIEHNNGEILVSTKVISLPLYGNQQIKQATCPKNHSLINYEWKIEGMPAIKLKATSDGFQRLINLDPIYGRKRHQYNLTNFKGKIIQFSCPECESSLIDNSRNCLHCGAPVCVINIPSQGVLEICSKDGCEWQRWEYIDAIGSIQYVESSVADNGCGISGENLEKIFEPFYSTKGQNGTGLGLSVIWGVVDNHGGTITVDSEPGKGTTFKLRLPVNKY